MSIDHPGKVMGFTNPGDQKVTIPVRNWNATKLALWRSKVAWGIAMRQAQEILDRCQHSGGCPGLHDETEPCLADRYEPDEEGKPRQVQIGCRDRETRMSALVILNAGRTLAPVDAVKLANEPYLAPSREFYSEVIASFAALQAELDAVYEAIKKAGITVEVTPPPQLSPSTPRLPPAAQGD